MQNRGKALLFLPWVLAALFIALVGLPGIACAEEQNVQTSTPESQAKLEITSVDQLLGKRLATINGGAFDTILTSKVEGIT